MKHSLHIFSFTSAVTAGEAYSFKVIALRYVVALGALSSITI